MTMKEESKRKPVVVKVTHVQVTREGRTERELTGKELEEWKKAHGYNTDTENQSDTE